MRAARRAPPTCTSTERWWSTSSACSQGSRASRRRAVRAGPMTCWRMLRKPRISDSGPDAGRPCMPRIGAPRRRTAEKSSSKRAVALAAKARPPGSRPPWPSPRGYPRLLAQRIGRRRRPVGEQFAGDPAADLGLLRRGEGLERRAPGQQAEFDAEAVQACPAHAGNPDAPATDAAAAPAPRPSPPPPARRHRRGRRRCRSAAGRIWRSWRWRWRSW